MYVIYSSKWDANRAVGQERLLSDLWLELTADDTSPVHWPPLYSSLQLLVNLQAVNRGAQEGVLMSVEAHTGEILAKHELSDLPRWGGLAIANGRLF